jgi:hypothetical protein
MMPNHLLDAVARPCKRLAARRRLWPHEAAIGRHNGRAGMAPEVPLTVRLSAVGRADVDLGRRHRCGCRLRGRTD